MPAPQASPWEVVPALLADFPSHDGRVAVPAERRFEGAVVISDIAGFTSLVEEVGQGARGAERIAQFVNRYFDRMVREVESHDGQVLRFAGDSMIALWTTRERSLDEAAARAATAGIALAALTEVAAGHQGVIASRIGVSAGPVWAGALGGEAGRAELLVGGRAVGAALAALSHAEPGELIATADFMRHAVPDLRTNARAGGHALVVHAAPASNHSSSERTLPPATIDPAPFVPDGLRDPERRSGRDWLAEFRRVHVTFFSFDLDFEDATTLHRAHEATRALQSTVYRYGGSVNQLVVEERGTTLLAGWGLPGFHHEDGATRALRAAHDGCAALAGVGIRCRVGVATGPAFVGLRGSAHRYELAVFGKTVNLAARLAQAMDDGVACDDATAEEAARTFDSTTTRRIAAKGFSDPVAIHRTVQRSVGTEPMSHTRRGARRSVGRATERETLTSLLDGAAESTCVAVVEGEAGSGKSTLLSEVTTDARAAGFTLLAGTGDSVETSTPYFAWRPILAALFPGVAGGERLARAVAQRLETDPAVRGLAPLLDIVLPTGLEDDEVTRQLTGRPRAESTRRAIVHLLRHEAEQRRLLIVLDDAHWLDSASWALALEVARTLGSGAMLIAGRPLSSPGSDAAAVLALPGMTHVALRPLDRENVSALLRGVLGGGRVSDRLARWVHERTEGNPYFCEQVARSLVEAGHLVEREGTFDVAATFGDDLPDLPDTIQSALVGRIDRLSPEVQLTLKASAVIGRTFSSELLAAIRPQGAAVHEHVAELVRSDLLRGGVGGEHEFAHPLLKDAAYQLLTSSQRRHLHRAVADWLRARSPDDAHLAPLLAHHFVHAEDTPLAVRYLEIAGRRAAAAFASEEAITFFSRATDVSAKGSLDVEPLRRARWERAMGEAHLKLLRYSDCERHLDRALALLDRPVPPSRARLVGGLLAEVAVQFVHRVTSKSPGDPHERTEALLEAADVVEMQNELAFFRNDVLKLIYGSVRQLNVAERAGVPSRQLAHSYATVAIPAGLFGLHKLSRRYAEWSDAAVAGVDHLSAVGYTNQVLALYHQGFARWSEVDRHVERSLELFERVGDRHRLQQCLALRTVYELHSGKLDECRASAARLQAGVSESDPAQLLSWAIPPRAMAELVRGAANRDTTRELDELSRRELHGAELVLVLGVLALAYEFLDHEDALPTARRALAEADKIMPATYFSLWGYAGLTETLVRALGRRPSRDLDAECKRACGHLGRFAMAFPLGRPAAKLWRGRLDIARGKSKTGASSVRAALDLAEAMALPHEAAIAARTLYQLGDGAVPDASRRAEAFEATLGASSEWKLWSGRALSPAAVAR